MSKQWCKISPEIVRDWSIYRVKSGWWTRLVQPGEDKVSGKLRAAYNEVMKKGQPGSLQRFTGREWKTMIINWTGKFSTVCKEKKKITMRIPRHCIRMARDVMIFVSLEVFMTWLNEALRNITWIQVCPYFQQKLGLDHLLRSSCYLLLWP